MMRDARAKQQASEPWPRWRGASRRLFHGEANCRGPDEPLKSTESTACLSEAHSMYRRTLISVGCLMLGACFWRASSSNQASAIAADVTYGLERIPAPSVLAKQAMDELWALREKGEAIPAGVPSISVWSDRYLDALRRENLLPKDYAAKLLAHSDFMEKYTNAVIEDRLSSQLMVTDASYAFARVCDVVREVSGGKPRPAAAASAKEVYGPASPKKP